MDNETANTLRRILHRACDATKPGPISALTDDELLEYAARAQEHATRAVFAAGFIGVHVEIYQVNLRAGRVELVAEVHGCPSISVEI